MPVTCFILLVGVVAVLLMPALPAAVWIILAAQIGLQAGAIIGMVLSE